jgi:hypothetical protein
MLSRPTTAALLSIAFLFLVMGFWREHRVRKNRAVVSVDGQEN